MSASMLGYLLGSFAMSLLFAAVWLIICKVIPSLRTNLKASYGSAIGLSFVPALLSAGVSNTAGVNFLGAFLCGIFLFWQYKRAQSKLSNSSKVSDSETPSP